VVSALVFAGEVPARLRSAWQQRLFEPLASRATAAELIRVLSYPKFRLTPQEQEELMSDYLPWCTVVPMSGRMPEIPTCRDPGDRPFLLLALAGRADVLVTGDDDLHALADAFQCAIMNPSQFLDALTEPDPRPARKRIPGRGPS
jgi:uncharacterized protein